MPLRLLQFYALALVAEAAAAGVPNDPEWTNSAYLQGLGLESVWASFGFNLGTAGRETPVIAIVDNGVPVSNDLKLWTNEGEIPDNGIDDDGNGYIDDVNGYNFVRRNADISFSGSHGASISRIAGSLTHNGLGTASPSSVASLMPVLYFESVPGGHFAAVDAILYAIQNGADVINCSFTSGLSQMYPMLLSLAEEADCILVAGAGNGGLDLDETPLFPASLDHPLIVTVGSLAADNIIGNSNFGAGSVDIFAPGSSTSFATPLVASTLALLKALKPAADSRELIWALYEGVDPLPSLEGKCTTGGKLNIAGAVEALLSDRYDGSPGKPPPPEIQGIFMDQGTLFLEWDASGSAIAYDVQISFGNHAFSPWTRTMLSELVLDERMLNSEAFIIRVRSIGVDGVSEWAVSQLYTRTDLQALRLSDPVHFWYFDEGVGSWAMDSGSGSMNLPLTQDIAWERSPGSNCSHLLFTGNHSGVEIPDASSINLTSHEAFTVAFSIYLDPSTERQTAVIYEQGGYWRGLNLFLEEGWLTAGAWNRPASESDWKGTFLSGGLIPSGEWIHVALVLNASEGAPQRALRLYINGSEVDSGPAYRLWTSYEQTGIGQIRGGTVIHGREMRYLEPFQGGINGLGIWHQALESDEISLLLP